ncbi:hypothetical protein COV06_01375 [Candidatus Uhrbacteria bacterium CG10_big_fil_rev_8_21_14_0_10_50_16]|uniref:Uncharacterized protein n=1 Tax=Candidatus Uhrbacteria bacterium CG10_big_fil_rev_8_21_14_0_10_50_16 TaxID=1975039 RepID=A0A2H0RNA0_9BACT|nr:MAG: hypothetical protein COV06_01375 [Candidatus Uhrbacteria bacterium CG10_big_fil_rev_8_21_14_0_10_50_16]
MAKQQFYVKGTHCKSCEVVIERELIQQAEILTVDVSHNKQTLTIETEGDKEFSHGELNTLLQKHDYTVGGKQKGGLQKPKIKWQRVGAGVVLAIALYLVLNATGLLRISPSSAQPSSLLGILVIGLIASVSSCTAVVGGLVAAVSSAVAKTQERLTTFERMRPHILFNIGRIGGFFVLGALIGLVGSALQLNITLNAVFLIVVAVMMMVIGINLMEIFPTPVVGMPKWLSHKIHDLAESKDAKAPLVLGAATFFLPCGFTQSMQLLALSLQDPLMSGVVMALFALGTAPVLLGIGSLTAYAKGTTLKRAVQVAGLVVLVLGMSNITNGMTLLGINTDQYLSVGPVEAGQAAVQNGARQEVTMEVTSRGSYEPNILTVKKGVPVDWKITGADFLGCADTLVLPAFNVNTRIKTGQNLVQFTPTKTGSFTFSCSMGMIRGTMIVTP